jgi:regulator of protease activity HflC (stomatin/prohibitin superfamily)
MKLINKIKAGLAGIVLASGIGLASSAIAAEPSTKESYSQLPVASVGVAQVGGYVGGALGLALGVYALSGIRILRPTQRGLVERFGKYRRFSNPGLTWILTGIDHLRKVNITEQMVDAMPQEVITKDNLNAKVDAQIYFKVKSDEEDVKKSQYQVADYQRQIVALTRTTLRSIVGTMSLKEANSERAKINTALAHSLSNEANNWGIEVVRAELKEIDPPKDVQETMNKVVKALNEKEAAIDYATAAETKADGERRAEIKKAEGIKQGMILEAQGKAEAMLRVAEAEAKAIQFVNESAEKYFKGNAVIYRQLDVAEKTMTHNSKYFIPQGTSLVAFLGDEGKKEGLVSVVAPQIVEQKKHEKA